MNDDTVIVRSATERRNPDSLDIDTATTRRILEVINDQDVSVPVAVRAALPAVERLVDEAVRRYEAGGDVHYFGAGTSGRIAVLDAAEIPPTYSVPPDRVVAHHAGGANSIIGATEGIEDDASLGRREAAAVVTPQDIVIGIAASGRTPYVVGALREAVDRGAFTALVSSRADGPIDDLVDVHVFVDTGPEVVAGSTRMKAGTAQKLVLNAFSTALMIRLGKTYSNLMVDVAPSNAKLRGRVLTILMEATGASQDDCVARLEAAGGDTKVALVSLLADADLDAARAALSEGSGRVRAALAVLGVDDPPTPRLDAADPGASSPLSNDGGEAR